MAKMISTEQAAESLGVSPRRVRSLITEGKLKATKLGRDYAIDPADVLKVTVYRKRGRPRLTSPSGSPEATKGISQKK